MTVIAATELDDFVASRIGSRQAQGAHRRLGAGIDKAHHLNRGYAVDNQLRQFALSRGGAPKLEPRSLARAQPPPRLDRRGPGSLAPTTGRNRGSGCRPRHRDTGRWHDR